MSKIPFKYVSLIAIISLVVVTGLVGIGSAQVWEDDDFSFSKERFPMLELGQPENILCYRIVCLNDNTAASVEGTITDTLPTAVTFVKAEIVLYLPSFGYVPGAGQCNYDEATRTLTCSDLTIPPAETIYLPGGTTQVPGKLEVWVTVRVNDDFTSGTITNTAAFLGTPSTEPSTQIERQASVETQVGGGVSSENIQLTPAYATNPIFTQHTVTATVRNDDGTPITRREVSFTIVFGPNTGKTFSGTTNADGEVSGTYVGEKPSTVTPDILVATDGSGITAQCRKEWTVPTVASANSAGIITDVFSAGEPVYAVGSGYAPMTSYTLYIFVDQTWNSGSAFPSAVKTTDIKTDAAGSIPAGTMIWDAAVTGEYDIVVDVNGNGGYENGNPDKETGEFYGYDALDADSDVGFEIIAEQIQLAPASATNPIGTWHTVTATVLDNGKKPIPDREVSFTIIFGPNAGKTSSGTTNADGKVSWAYLYAGEKEGTDVIRASMRDAQGTVIRAHARKEWTVPAPVEDIPEFSTIALPVAAIIGLLFFFNTRKRRED